MNVRIFKSTAFSPISPNRSRSSGYEYRAFAVDTLPPPNIVVPPLLGVQAQYIDPGFNISDGVGVDTGPVFLGCMFPDTAFNLNFTLVNPADSGTDFIFQVTNIAGDSDFSLSLVPETELPDATLAIGDSYIGALQVAFSQSPPVVGTYGAILTLNYTAAGVAHEFTIPLSVEVIDCDGINPISGPLDGDYQNDVPFDNEAEAQAVLDSLTSNCIGKIRPTDSNPARVTSFSVVQTNAKTLTISGEATWQAGDSDAQPIATVYLQTNGITSGFQMDYDVQSAPGGTGSCGAVYVQYGCCGLTDNAWDPFQDDATSATDSLSGSFNPTIAGPDVYGLQLVAYGKAGAASVQFEWTVFNVTNAITPSQVVAFFKNGQGGRTMLSCS